MNSSNKPKTASIFANKSDLLAAQRRIAELEAEARQARRGLWRSDNPVAPWNFRHPPP